MRGRWSAAALVALVVLSAGLAQTSPGHDLLHDLGFYQTPGYTELAFTTPYGLPTQLQSTHSPIQVSFGIHNVSGSPKNYRWSITLVQSGHSHVSASGVAATQAQGRATVAKTVAATCGSGRLQVVIRLSEPAESIDFWATCP
jgi:hypothetical protein